MHPVDCNEFLGKRVWRAMMVRQRLRNALECMLIYEPDAPLRPPVLWSAVPVRVQPDFNRLSCKYRRRPFDCMDLCDERRDNQPCCLIDALWFPCRVLPLQGIAQHVVLAREQRVHHTEAEPPALVESSDVIAGDVAW